MTIKNNVGDIKGLIKMGPQCLGNNGVHDSFGVIHFKYVFFFYYIRMSYTLQFLSYYEYVFSFFAVWSIVIIIRHSWQSVLLSVLRLWAACTSFTRDWRTSTSMTSMVNHFPLPSDRNSHRLQKTEITNWIDQQHNYSPSIFCSLRLNIQMFFRAQTQPIPHSITFIRGLTH